MPEPDQTAAWIETAAQIERLADCLHSPNVTDSNGEAANLVDVLDRHANSTWSHTRATYALADSIRILAAAITALARSYTEETEPDPEEQHR